MRFLDNPILWSVVAVLAVWRITSIVQKEEIASPIRKAVGIIEPDGEDPEYWIYPDSWVGKLFHCFWCGSVWSAFLVTPVLVFFPPALFPFALSAAAIAFKTWLEKPTIQHNENIYVDSDALEEYEDDDGVAE